MGSLPGTDKKFDQTTSRLGLYFEEITPHFQGSLKQMSGWAFSYGPIVDAITGFTDVSCLDWADKHQAPPRLFKW